MVIHVRAHETGDCPRMRVWTDQDAGYGSFGVLCYADYLALKSIAKLLGWVWVEHED